MKCLCIESLHGLLIAQNTLLDPLEPGGDRRDHEPDEDDADDDSGVVAEVGAVLHVPSEPFRRADQLGGGQQQEAEDQAQGCAGQDGRHGAGEQNPEDEGASAEVEHAGGVEHGLRDVHDAGDGVREDRPERTGPDHEDRGGAE